MNSRRFPSGAGPAFALYEAAWIAARPFLARNARLRDGWDERTLRRPLPRADLWIQAASAGEAYLALEIFRAADGFAGHRTLATTGTRQGMEILAGVAGWERAFFPFDRPSIMARAVEQVRPRIAVLLETELWPGHLAALRSRGIPILLLNGRITERSLRGYGRTPSLWRGLRPDFVAAVSSGDANRFAALFGPERIVVMPNIKFDRSRRAGKRRGASPGGAATPEGCFRENAGEDPGNSMGDRWFAPGVPVVVLGSVRREEEAAAMEMIRRIRKRVPDAVVAVAPRHLHRVSAWTALLSGAGLSPRLRSELSEPLSAGTAAVWDVFGELDRLYGAADAVFVGGSLAPLGGQNFMEPLARGRIPVIGPHWDHFSWIGEAVFRQGLAVRVPDAEKAADALIAALENPPDRTRVREAAWEYVAARSGGARKAREWIGERLAAGRTIRSVCRCGNSMEFRGVRD